jgi:dTDP-glucose pyrophosphorylase
VTVGQLAGTVAATGTLRDALAAVDLGGAGIALAVDDEGRLVGVVTDGDIRRALLGGVSLTDAISTVVNESYVAVASSQSRADALDLMRARRLNAIPAVDGERRPVALHLLHAFLEPDPRPNWAVVMAGGEGRRLRPLTETVPKPMLRVAGRPILERIVLHLVGAGITRVFIAVNYLADVIEGHFGDGSALGVRIEYLREERPLATAGALGLLPAAPSVPLLLLNGDLVTNVDLGAMLDAHHRRGYAATVGVRRYAHTIPFGCVERDGDRIVRLEEKPTLIREVNTGIYVLEPWVVALVEGGVPTTMPDVIGQVLVRGDPVGAFEVEDDWIDVGQRDELLRAREGA